MNMERDKGYKLDEVQWYMYSVLRKSQPDKAEDIKRGLRNRYKAREQEWAIVPHKCEDYDDYCRVIYKRYYPNGLTADEFDMLVEEEWMHVHYADGRDCTGQRFTCWIDRFEIKGGGTWVYHCTTLDV